jgi:protease I
MAELSGKRVAVIATDGFEQSELTEPVKALKDAGAQVDIVSNKAGEIKGMQHDKPGVSVKVDRTLKEVRPDDYDALELPGGAMNADAMRMVPELQQFLRAFQSAGKPMAIICHAPWELVSAGLVRGRTLTSYHTIQDDLRNAGAHWVDQEVVVDGNWVTSRQPGDLPAFNREMVNLFARVPAMSAR